MTPQDLRSIVLAMRDTDLCCRIRYKDELRHVSPIRFTFHRKIVLCYCLRTGRPKNFYLEHIQEVTLLDSNDITIGE